MPGPGRRGWCNTPKLHAPTTSSGSEPGQKYESGIINDPVTVEKSAKVQDVLEIMQQHRISGVPVVDGPKVIGIVTSRDLRFEKNMETPVSLVMTPEERLVTVKEGASSDEIERLLHQHRIEKVLIVTSDNTLKGLVTVKDIQKSSDYPNACKDQHGRLLVAAAVGVGEGTDERVERLVDAGVDAIVVDTAHGHSIGVLQRVELIKKLFPQVDVIGGNIATAAAAADLVAAGADGV